MSLTQPWRCENPPMYPAILSSRSPNVIGGYMPPNPRKSNDRRAVKRAPLPTVQQLREKTRQNYKHKVQEGREEKRFARHADDIMRQRDLEQQRQWEAEQARSSTQPASIEEWEEIQESEAERELREIEEAERRDMEALLHNMEQDDDQYGSDNELDALFEQMTKDTTQTDDAMDTS